MNMNEELAERLRETNEFVAAQVFTLLSRAMKAPDRAAREILLGHANEVRKLMDENILTLEKVKGERHGSH